MTSFRNTDGAKVLKLSRYLTLRLSIFCIFYERGSPRIDLLPSEHGSNLNQSLFGNTNTLGAIKAKKKKMIDATKVQI